MDYMMGIGFCNSISVGGGGGIVRNYNVLLTSTGNGTGVSTLRFQVSANMTLTLDGTARFYTDAAGTLGESTTWAITAGALRTIYLKVPSGTANLNIPDVTKIISWGTSVASGWLSGGNSASITAIISYFVNLEKLSLAGNGTLIGNASNVLTVIALAGTLKWEYPGALNAKLTFIYLDGSLIDWTGLSVGNDGNIALLSLSNYRLTKMSSPDMVTLLTQMTNRTGTLPATVTINDYADYASPPTTVTDAVALLKSTKGIVTVNLGS